jgi:hypothetical protein
LENRTGKSDQGARSGSPIPTIRYLETKAFAQIPAEAASGPLRDADFGRRPFQKAT